MAEWFKAAVLKTAFLPGNGGSNPSPSAMPRSSPWVYKNRLSDHGLPILYGEMTE
jgi:hypothetical protein